MAWIDKELPGWILIAIAAGAFTVVSGGMMDLATGLVVAEIMFFVLILLAFRIRWTKRPEVPIIKNNDETRLLHAEVQRLNRQNVELTQEISSLKYRN